MLRHQGQVLRAVVGEDGGAEVRVASRERVRRHVLRRVLGLHDNHRGQFFGPGEDVRRPRRRGKSVEHHPGVVRDGVAAAVPS